MSICEKKKQRGYAAETRPPNVLLLNEKGVRIAYLYLGLVFSSACMKKGRNHAMIESHRDRYHNRTR